MRLLLLASSILFAQGAYGQPSSYTYEKWPEDIVKIPCDAWTRNPDGSWLQVKQLIDISNTPNRGGMKGYDTFRQGAVEFSIIQKHCLPTAKE